MSACLSAPCHAAPAAWCDLLDPRASRAMIGACNSISFPIWGYRQRGQTRRRWRCSQSTTSPGWTPGTKLVPRRPGWTSPSGCSTFNARSGTRRAGCRSGAELYDCVGTIAIAVPTTHDKQRSAPSQKGVWDPAGYAHRRNRSGTIVFGLNPACASPIKRCSQEKIL